MKKIIIAALAVLAGLTAQAQQNEKHPFTDGLRIQLNGGLVFNQAFKVVDGPLLYDSNNNPLLDKNGEQLRGDYKIQRAGNGLSPQVDLRVAKFFWDKWGHSEWGVGARYSGPLAKIESHSFGCHTIEAEAYWDLVQTFWYNSKPEHFECVPYFHMGYVFSEYGGDVTYGLGGWLGWRFDSGLGIHGELRMDKFGGNVADMTDAGIIALTAAAGISWKF